ncbi:phage head closure protein [Pseudomonas petrae]|uniref:Phage head closure protein n=1 Tax=Pseudomonas petrae TaxID=2912190 RepID=A0ABS9IEQ0_9PSED|nr:phage head closure protein [Pseudomonas petrae]MCF7545556.1 phage head closure protein [Pseudomonas petrae]
MRAGPLRHRGSLQKQTRVSDGMGGYIQGWSSVRPVRAEITMPTGRTSPVAQQIKAVVTAEIRVRMSPDFKVGQRLAFVDGTYLIEAALSDNDRTMLRLLCSNAVNP